MRSIRSFNRVRTTDERGFALLWAIGLSVLFFMLIQLMLIESGRELTDAQRFRSRIVAMVLAENGAELAAKRLVDRQQTNDTDEDWQGKIHGEMRKNVASREFDIIGTGFTAGPHPTKAKVEVRGGFQPESNNVQIYFTKHTP